MKGESGIEMLRKLVSRVAGLVSGSRGSRSNGEDEGDRRVLARVNILKVRDDYRPVHFAGDIETGKFQLDEETAFGWSNGQEFGFQELRKRIEPWLTSLFQSEHLTLLVGSGLTHAVHKMVTGELAAGMDQMELSAYNTEIAVAAMEVADKIGRDKPNFEDQLRAANELRRGLQILGQAEAANGLQHELEHHMEAFANSILASEARIVDGHEDEREEVFNVLVTFLMSFASRSGVRDRLRIFTTNYDRLIEMGAEVAGLHLLDRFAGSLAPIFRSSRLELDMHYNPPGIRGEPRYLEGVARFTKLHGSVDWVQVGDDIRRIGLPFGAAEVGPYLKAPGLNRASSYELMIYPNAAKDRETADYPYVDLFRDLAAAICRPNNTLVTYGYSFGDEHINRVIRDMLTIPSTHLVVVSHDDQMGRIKSMYNELGRPSQISLLIGPALADLRILTEYYLPKAAIDKTMSRLGKLLQQRFGTEHELHKNNERIKEAVQDFRSGMGGQ